MSVDVVLCADFDAKILESETTDSEAVYRALVGLGNVV